MGNVVLLCALCKELAQEHDKIIRHLDSLEQFEGEQAIASGLSRLQRLLILHFGHEQMPDGLYDVLALWNSEHRSEVDGLIEEHRDILETVGTFLDSEYARGAVDFRASLASLCAMIRDHERREYALVSPLIGPHE
jgi:hypothetical protein